MSEQITAAHRRLAALAVRQHGVFTRDQARRVGISDRQIDHRIASGVFVVHRYGALGPAGVPPTWEQATMAAILAAGPGSLASHATAARLWDITPVPGSDGIHVMSPTPLRRSRSDGVIGHRSTLLVPSDLRRRRSIPVTSVARTLADCCGPLGIAGTGTALDDAVRRKLLTLDHMRATAARLMVKGRRHTGVLAAVLAERIDGYDLSESDLEVRALRLLRRAGLPAPVQQHRVRLGRRTVRLDLAYPELMVGIELDGWTWHRHRSSFDRDRARLSELVTFGWTVLVHTSRTLDHDLVRQVATLHRRAAS